MNNSTNFNTDDILNEVNLVIKKGLEMILKDYMSRYNLLEKTHKQIMNLPSVLNELNKDDEPSETIDANEDEPMFISIAAMTKELVNEGVKNIETKISRLEKNYDLILPIFDKIMKKIDDLNEEVKYIKKSPNEVKVIKCNDVPPHDETRENIKLEIQEEQHSESEVEKEEVESVESGEEEVEKEVEEDEAVDEKEVESVESVEEAQEEVEAQDESEVVAESEEEDEDEDEEEADEDEEEAVEEAEVAESVEEEVAESESVETESEVEEDESEEVEVEVELAESEEEETESEKEEEEEELFEIEIDDTPYCTNNEDSGFIFELTEDGDVGNKVGVFKEGEPFFYADEK